MTSKLKTFGFEIEGEFSEEVESELADLGRFKGDGSISSCGGCRNKGLEDKEYNSSVYTNNLSGIKEAMAVFKSLGKYGTDFHSNKSMGFHVHLGFEPKRPPELFYDKFFKEMTEALKTEFPEAYKLRAGNRYCKLNPNRRRSIDDKYAWQGDGDRYKAINLHQAMDTHGTLEIRFFPSGTPDEMLNYLRFCLKFVNRFLTRDFNEYLTVGKRALKVSLSDRDIKKVGNKLIKLESFV